VIARGVVASNDSHYHVMPNNILGYQMNNYKTMVINFMEGYLEGDVFNIEFESKADCLICDD